MIVMCDFSKYPNCPKEIPDSLLNVKKAYSIHMQTLERLNERGGLSPFEIVLNTENKSYRELCNDHDPKDELYYIDKLLKIINHE